MAHPPCLRIEVVGITGVQMMKNLMKISSRSLQKYMVVVGHQAETVNLRPISFGSRFEIAKKPLVVPLRPENDSSFIPSGGDVIKSAWILNS